MSQAPEQPSGTTTNPTTEPAISYVSIEIQY
jgi:hypothetical protein